MTCDVLVGADGLHSATRGNLYPNEGRHIYSGLVLYVSLGEVQAVINGFKEQSGFGVKMLNSRHSYEVREKCY